MQVYQAIILGLIQGLTEFLPISSSGHLLLASHLLNVKSDLFFDILLHVATLIPVSVVFFKDVIKVFSHPVRLLYLFLATLPAGIVGLIFNFFLESFFVSIEILPITFLFTSAIIYVTDKLIRQKDKKLTLKSSLFYGGMQVLALLPGVSRSGICISSGKILGISYEENLSFSFLMSIPIILGSFLTKCINGVNNFIFKPYMAWGFLFALIGGFMALFLIKRLIKKDNYVVFSIYLVALSVFVIFLV
jgi:undecaprenyl-diphosphatase